MRHSSRDMVAFICALNDRMLRTLKLLERRGATVLFTAELDQQLKCAGNLYARFVGQLDWRHNDRELGLAVALAEWLIAKDAELNGNTPREWKCDPVGMVTKSPLPRGSRKAFLEQLLNRNREPRDNHHPPFTGISRINGSH